MASCLISSAEPADSVSTGTRSEYIPHIHGVFRGRFEASTVESAYRFQVRNARLKIDGSVGRYVDYLMQTDFCDRGKIKILDAWAALKPIEGLNFRLGQFRVPFGIETFRGPSNYLFANRAFLAKHAANYRAVGFRAAYTLRPLPLTLEAGAFNPGTIDDHQPWRSTLTFATKATYRHSGITASVSYLSHKPQSRRINYLDAAAGYKSDSWGVEGEYIYSHPVHMGSCGISHAYLIQSYYAMTLRSDFFNRLSFEARFDGRTGAPEFSADPEEEQPCSYYRSRRRITLGSTISHLQTKYLDVHLRINYEKYLYCNHYRPDAEQGDKAVLELIVNF